MSRLLKIVQEATCNYTNLVLGAWGCGVFGNDPRLVADVFAKALNGKYKDVFKRVSFSIYDKTEEQSTLKAFREILSPENNE